MLLLLDLTEDFLFSPLHFAAVHERRCFGSKSSGDQDEGGATAQLGTTSNPSHAQGSGGWVGAGGGGAGGAGGGPAPPPLPIPPNERCVLEGPGLQQVAGFAGESTHFMVACFKEGGGEFDHFVVSNLIVEITGPATLEPTVAATKIGAKVSYTARKAGNYSISIKYFGDDLPGSPMPVSILAGERCATFRPRSLPRMWSSQQHS